MSQSPDFPPGSANEFARSLDRDRHARPQRYTNGQDGGIGPPPALNLAFGLDAAKPLASLTVVPGVLYRRSVSLLYGAPKSGKSFLATDLALAVADLWTEHWMGRPVLHHGPVLYVSCEGHAGFWKRLQAAKIHRNWDDASFPENFVLATGRPALVISTDGGRLFAPQPDAIMAAIETCQRRGTKPITVMVDTVFRSFGSGNVNNSDHMNAYLAALTEIADQDLAVVAVHHETKGSQSPAGSVSLIGGCDTVIRVARDDTGARSWEIELAKDDAEGNPVGFRLDVIDIGSDADGLPAASCVVISDGTTPLPTPKGPKLPDAATICLRALDNLLAGPEAALLPPSNDLPANTWGVGADLWRREVYAMKGDDQSLNRQTFHRGQNVLLSRSLVMQKNGYVWRCKRDSNTETKRDSA